MCVYVCTVTQDNEDFVFEIMCGGVRGRTLQVTSIIEFLVILCYVLCFFLLFSFVICFLCLKEIMIIKTINVYEFVELYLSECELNDSL